jgi:hypothetical protein
MIEIKLKCETASEAADVPRSSKGTRWADDFAYWLRNEMKHGSHTEEEHALLEVVSKEFYDRVGEML